MKRANIRQTDIQVALIDNHALFLDGLEQMLHGQEGIKVLFTAANGQDMQHQIQRHGVPDVVLMDIKMGIMNGYRATQWLTDNHPRVAVLAVTAFEDEDAVEEMLRCGARGYITKAEGHAELYKAILEVAKTGKYINDRVSGRKLHAAVDGGAIRKSMDVLNERKQEFLELCCSDLSYEQIGQQLEVSHAAVKRYAEELYMHFGVRTRHALVAHAFRMGLIATEEDGE